MSVRVRVDQISDQQIATIRKLLLITPADQRDYTKYNYEVDVKDPIQCWLNDDDYVRLPYRFATILFGQNLNMTYPYPDMSFQFTSSLLRTEYKDQYMVCCEAFGQLREFNTTRLELHTGHGKTVETSYLLSMLGGLSLVVVPREGLLQQWESTFIEHTTATPWIIDTPVPGTVGVIITTPGKIYKIDQQLGPGWLKSVKNLVIDEAHMFCTRTGVQSLLLVEPLNIIACTATYERSSDELHHIMTSFVGTHRVYRKSKKPFTVIKYMTGIKVPIEKNFRGQTDWSKLVARLVQNEQRNLMALKLIKENHSKCKIMVLTWRKEHAKQMCQWIRQIGITSDFMAGTKKNYQDSNVLVGTVHKVGTGFDEKAKCTTYNGVRIDLLIILGSTKNPQFLEQIVGRGMRSEQPKIIHFVDDLKISKRHWTIANKWYKSRNSTIIKFESQFCKDKKKNQMNTSFSPVNETSDRVYGPPPPNQKVINNQAQRMMLRYTNITSTKTTASQVKPNTQMQINIKQATNQPIATTNTVTKNTIPLKTVPSSYTTQPAYNTVVPQSTTSINITTTTSTN